MADYHNSSFPPHAPPSSSSVRTPVKRALYRNQDETINSTSYHDYPSTKPFINSDYRRSSSKPPSACPENKRTAVISALKSLQDKIKKLELERGAAENNLKSLAAETIRYKDILQRDHENEQPVQSNMSKHTQESYIPQQIPHWDSIPAHAELESQLSSAETRCNLLEKQLDYMRKMVQNAEVDRQSAMAKTSVLERKQEDPFDRSHQDNIRQHEPKQTVQFSAQTEKINDLEREHLKLTATQALAENKIRELEIKLQEEQHHRKLIEEKATEMKSAAQANRILMNGGYVDEPVAKVKKVKKKKKSAPSKKLQTQPPPPKDYCKHYRLNLAEIPFVAGKSSAPSHSVGANVQRVLSLMKSHNLALCTALNHVNGDQRSTSPSSGSSQGSVNNDLADILLQLQDEFGQMSFEHQELSRQISEVTDPRLRDDLERELDSLVTRMEAKSQQISKLRKNQVKLVDKKKKKISNKKASSAESTPRSKSASGSSYNTNGEVEVTTTIKTKGHAGKVHVRPTSAREVSLNVLKDMKKLQTTLRKDDVCWE